MDQNVSRHPHLDRIRGGLAGGAVGDALGYPVEFLSWKAIRNKYGPDGIQAYDLDFGSGTAIVSDDTQMSLFTANGILIGETEGRLEGIRRIAVADYVYVAYQEWLRTQGWGADRNQPYRCWLFEIPELHHGRAPGTTCLSA